MIRIGVWRGVLRLVIAITVAVCTVALAVVSVPSPAGAASTINQITRTSWATSIDNQATFFDVLQSDGTGAVTWTVTSGDTADLQVTAIPGSPSATVSIVSGAPIQAGATYSLIGTMQDADGRTGTWGYSLTITSGTILQDAPFSNIADAVPVNQAASAQLAAQPGTFFGGLRFDVDPSYQGPLSVNLSGVVTIPASQSPGTFVISGTMTDSTFADNGTWTFCAVVGSPTVPCPPTNVTASKPSDGSPTTTIAWDAPASDGGSPLTNYDVTITDNTTPANGGQTCSTADASTATCDLTGLTAGDSYTAAVVANNANGSSPSGSVTFTEGAPSAPTTVSAAGSAGSAVVSFGAPLVSGDGSTIAQYEVTAIDHTTPANGGQTAIGSSSPIGVPGLDNGDSYSFTVVAFNSSGAGAPSGPSNSVTPSSVPGAATNVNATAGDTTASVTWTAPDANGLPITGYTASDGLGDTCTTATTTCVVTGLTNGTAYTFTVVATNANGDGPASSASNSVTPDVAPAAPTAVTASAGNAEASVSWTVPAPNGGTAITGYTVTSSPGSKTCTTATATCVVTGLTNGTAYTFTVVATNNAGTGLPSSASNSVTPDVAPAAPTAVTASAGNAEASVSWTAPAPNGGTAITGYTVTSSPGSKTCTTATTSCTVTGLTNGTAYTFTVSATNNAGTGLPSSASTSVTPSGLPEAATNVTGVAGNLSASISWTAAGANGSPVTTYTVTSSPGAKTCTTATTSCTVTGLTNGTAYTFTVVATNANGDGPASAASASVTPALGPITQLAPTGGTVSTTGSSNFSDQLRTVGGRGTITFLEAPSDHSTDVPVSASGAVTTAGTLPVGNYTVGGTTSDGDGRTGTWTYTLHVTGNSGYRLVGNDGGVFAFGGPPYEGSLPGLGIQVRNVVGMVATADGNGYWMVGSDGGVFAFGNAGFIGSLPGLGVHVNNIVSFVPTPSGNGYWMVGRDGGVFAFGDAGFVGSLPGLGVHVNNIVGIVGTADHLGYIMVGNDGGVFTFGDATFEGSIPASGVHVNNIVGILGTPSGLGYSMVGSDGSVFNFGDAPNWGSLPALGVSVNNIVAISAG